MSKTKLLSLLILDNYDSFTFNLVHVVEQLPIQFEVYRNDQIALEEVDRFDRILLSPGPGLPKDAGILPEVLARYAETKPMLGVCLGMQAMVEYFGGTLENMAQVRHGVSTPIEVLKPVDDLFADVPSPFEAGRYHSWAARADALSSPLQVTAVDEDGFVMALKHAHLPLRGVQFHPESVMTQHGRQILANWLNA